jgi:beta-glucosidase-like glycosyl hydrolase
MRLKNTVSFPRNAILGAQKDYDLVYEMSQEIGRQLASIGVHMNLAPVVDVNSNPRNPVIGSRSFGDNPHDVALNGIAFARGLHDAGILSCAKHFPGHGDTTTDSHVTLPVVNHPRERLDSIELAPFIELINHQIPAIMTAHLAVPALEPDITKPASLSRAVVTDLLKNELQFTGLVITDGLGMRGASDAYKPGELELQALLAGNDILLCPLDVPKAALLIEQAITDGHFAEQELNHRVEKILRAKAWAFNHHPESVNPVYDYKQLHTPHAYALQKRFEHVPAQSSTFIPAGH